MCASGCITSRIFFGCEPQTPNALCVSWSPGLHPLSSSELSEDWACQHARKLKTQPQRQQKHPLILGCHHGLLVCAVLPGPCSAAGGTTSPSITFSSRDGWVRLAGNKCGLWRSNVRSRRDHLPSREAMQQTWAFTKGHLLLADSSVFWHNRLEAFPGFWCPCLKERQPRSLPALHGNSSLKLEGFLFAWEKFWVGRATAMATAGR